MKTSADVGVLRHCNSDSYPDRLGFTPVNSRLSVEDWSRCGLDTYPPLVLDLNVRSVVDLNVRFATSADRADPYLKSSALWSWRRNHWKADLFTAPRLAI
jgi:hypothetical protein